MAEEEYKILKTCPMCDKELKTETDVIVEQGCSCGFNIDYLPPVDGDFDNKILNSCCIEIAVFGKKNIETILKRIAKPDKSVVALITERDRMKAVLVVVRELEKEYGTAETKAIELLVHKEYGLTPYTTREIIAVLKKRAELYVPRHGHYKIV